MVTQAAERWEKASQRDSATSHLVGQFPVRRLPRVPVGVLT